VRSVVIVNHGQHRAGKKAKKYLDAFGRRIGQNVWEVQITDEGLQTLYGFLKKKAVKGTRLSCFTFFGGRRKLLWTIGMRNFFDEYGAVAVSTTGRTHPFFGSGDTTFAGMSLLKKTVWDAALLHDIGKANPDFLKILSGEMKKNRIRHEGLSCLAVSMEERGAGRKWRISREVSSGGEGELLPFEMGDYEGVVRALIGTHHRLFNKRHGDRAPSLYPTHHYDGNGPLSFTLGEGNGKEFERISAEILHSLDDRKIPEGEIERVEGNPFLSRALFLYGRLALMAADHFVSGAYEGGADAYWKANPKSGLLLHLKKVAAEAARTARKIPVMKHLLPGVEKPRREEVERSTRKKEFRWQNDISRLVRDHLKDGDGAFVAIVSGTGTGKTRGGAKVMSVLAGREDLRFTTVLGLRTLTMQTGKAYAAQCGFSPEDLAVLTGGRLIPPEDGDLDEQTDDEVEVDVTPFGEASFIPENMDEAMRDLGAFASVVQQTFGRGIDTKKAAFLYAPVLVCTTDYLATAGDWRRSWHLLAQLRMASSDLLIDEPDIFDHRGIVALGRMCYLAGLFGRKVVLSSATLMPEIVEPLYRAYSQGWSEYREISGRDGEVRFFALSNLIEGKEVSSPKGYEKFCRRIEKKAAKIEGEHPLRRGKIVDISESGEEEAEGYAFIAKKVLDAATGEFFERNSTEGVASCLVRFHWINSVVKFAGALPPLIAGEGIDEEFFIEIVVYHSRFPKEMRAETERYLDENLSRKGKTEKLIDTEFGRKFRQSGKKKGLLIVVASPVEEVGRDHDFDFGFVEPVSASSTAQLCGRINRHRRKPLDEGQYNVGIFSHHVDLLFKSPKSSFPISGISDEIRQIECEGAGMMEIGCGRKADEKAIASIAESPSERHLIGAFDKAPLFARAERLSYGKRVGNGVNLFLESPLSLIGTDVFERFPLRDSQRPKEVLFYDGEAFYIKNRDGSFHDVGIPVICTPNHLK